MTPEQLRAAALYLRRRYRKPDGGMRVNTYVLHDVANTFADALEAQASEAEQR